jgi:peptide/nickel transport system ATP-binding protein
MASGATSERLGAGAPGAGTILDVVDLKTHFYTEDGIVKAVDGVSFRIDKGKVLGVVGESGCGKSTLMKTILGLHPPTRGEIVFDGSQLSGLDRREMRAYRSHVGFVQQDPYGALPPFMTVERVLQEPLVINQVKDKEQREQRIRAVMEEVKMTPVEDFLTKFPHMLSGGQQQRVVIARSMIMNPKLIVADEPVSMLDASVRVEILKLLRGLQASHNLAVIYITHDLSTVRYFSERIFVMYAGKLVEKAKVADLLRQPLHPYTHALLSATCDPDYRNALVFREVPPGEPPSLITPPPGCRFHPRCPQAIKGLCEVEDPPDFQPEPEHWTACWLYR